MQTRRSTRLLGASVLAVGLAFAACSSDPQQAQTPAGPSPTPTSDFQVITITPNGISPSQTYITPGYPLRIVNNDVRPHRLHLNDIDEPGCANFDLAGEIPAGESRLTGVIGEQAVGCSVHDHLSHGDARFSAELLVDIIG